MYVSGMAVPFPDPVGVGEGELDEGVDVAEADGLDDGVGVGVVEGAVSLVWIVSE